MEAQKEKSKATAKALLEKHIARGPQFVMVVSEVDGQMVMDFHTPSVMHALYYANRVQSLIERGLDSAEMTKPALVLEGAQ